MTITGGCRCGAVRYIIDTEPLFARHCWCTQPRRKRHADAPPILSIRGTPLFTQADTRRRYIGVRAGTLDDPELGKPQITIWTSSAPSWACFDPGLPQEERQSPPGK